MSEPIKTERLDLYEHTIMRATAFGRLPCVLFTAMPNDDGFPTLIVGSGFLIRMKGEYLLSHLLIEDEGRRMGFATEIVRFYEDRLGKVSACWASESGMAFGRDYIERFGPRPHWRTEHDPRVEALIASLAPAKYEGNGK